MAKVKAGQSSSKVDTTKAGKKSGPYQEPPTPKPAKLEARLAGEKQFVAKTYPAPLPAPQGSWEAAMDVLCLAFGVRRIRPPRRDDTGLRYDPTRKQYISPPRRDNSDR